MQLQDLLNHRRGITLEFIDHALIFNLEIRMPHNRLYCIEFRNNGKGPIHKGDSYDIDHVNYWGHKVEEPIEVPIPKFFQELESLGIKETDMISTLDTLLVRYKVPNS